MLAIGYARVSTQDQSVDMQVAAMERYGVKSACIFTDTLSGAHAQRPGFIEAIRAAQQPGSEFVVWKLDRLGRTVTGVIDTMQLLDSRGVRVYSLTERLDLGTPFGKAMVGFLAVFAELERNLIRERTLAGLRRAKERGGAHGRPVVMTAPRIQLAMQMVDERRNVVGEIWPALLEIDGAPLSKSALYSWIRDYKQQEREAA